MGQLQRRWSSFELAPGRFFVFPWHTWAHNISSLCWFNFGAGSETVGQHLINISIVFASHWTVPHKRSIYKLWCSIFNIIFPHVPEEGVMIWTCDSWTSSRPYVLPTTGCTQPCSWPAAIKATLSSFSSWNITMILSTSTCVIVYSASPWNYTQVILDINKKGDRKKQWWWLWV